MQRLINVYLVALVATTTFFFAQAGPTPVVRVGSPRPVEPTRPAGPPPAAPVVRTCSSSSSSQGNIIFSADLTNGSYYIANGWQISWLKSLGPETGKCNLQGVVKITFPPSNNGQQNCKLKFDLHILESDLNNDKGWVFDIADSTNDGFGGDAGHSSNCAEVHNQRQRFLVYSNTLAGYQQYTNAQSLKVADTHNAMSPFVTVTVGDEFVEFDNHLDPIQQYQSPYLFTLNGQATNKGSVNRDIFFSMNRVVYPHASTSRTGVGLCKAVIKAIDCSYIVTTVSTPYQQTFGPQTFGPPGK